MQFKSQVTFILCFSNVDDDEDLHVHPVEVGGCRHLPNHDVPPFHHANRQGTALASISLTAIITSHYFTSIASKLECLSERCPFSDSQRTKSSWFPGPYSCNLASWWWLLVSFILAVIPRNESNIGEISLMLVAIPLRLGNFSSQYLLVSHRAWAQHLQNSKERESDRRKASLNAYQPIDCTFSPHERPSISARYVLCARAISRNIVTTSMVTFLLLKSLKCLTSLHSWLALQGK